MTRFSDAQHAIFGQDIKLSKSRFPIYILPFSPNAQKQEDEIHKSCSKDFYQLQKGVCLKLLGLILQYIGRICMHSSDNNNRIKAIKIDLICEISYSFLLDTNSIDFALSPNFESNIIFFATLLKRIR